MLWQCFAKFSAIRGLLKNLLDGQRRLFLYTALSAYPLGKKKKLGKCNIVVEDRTSLVFRIKGK